MIARPKGPVNLEPHLTERAHVLESGVRPGAVEFFMNETPGLSADASRKKLRELGPLYRWNAATLGAILRAIRATRE